MSTVSVTNLKLRPLTGSDRSLIAEWEAPTGPLASEKVSYRIKKGKKYPTKYKTIAAGAYASYVEKYVVQTWQIKDGVKLWSSQSDANGLSYEFSVDSEATSAGIKVTPVSKDLDTFVNKQKTKKKYFDVSASSASVVFSGEAPLSVEPPEIDVIGTTVTVTCSASDSDVRTYRVYLTSAESAPQVKEVSSSTGEAVAVFTVAPGAIVSAFFEAYTEAGACTSSTASETVQAIPETPQIDADDMEFDQALKRAVIEWTECAGADEYRVEYATDPAHFTSAPGEVKSIDGVTASRAFVYDLEDGLGWYFRVRAENETGESGFSDVSPMLPVGTAPAAPTVYQSKDYLFKGESVVFGWVHNPTDGTAQTVAEVQVNDGSVNTVIVGAEQAVTYANDSSSADRVLWRVRTWGYVQGDGGASEWSEWQELPVFPGREAALDFDGSAVYVSYHGYDLEAFAYIEAMSDYDAVNRRGELVHISSGDVLWSAADFWQVGEGANKRYKRSFLYGDVLFGDAKDFRFHAVAFVDGGRTQAGKRVSFRVDVEEVKRVSLAGPDEESFLGITCDQSALSAEIVSDPDAYVYRVNPDGSLDYVGMNGYGATKLTDLFASFGAQRYRAVSVGRNGVGLVTEREVSAIVCEEVVIDFGSKRLRLPYNVRLGHSNNQARELVRFAGSDQPSLYVGDYEGEVVSISAELMRGQNDEAIRLCHELMRYGGQVHVRTPDGFSFKASAVVAVSPKYENKAVEVSVEVSRVA